MIIRTGLWILCAIGVAGSVVGGERLEWKFKTGDVLTYNVQNTMDSTAVVNGVQSGSSIQQTMRMVWDVETRGADGSYVLGQTIQRIKVRMSPDGQNFREFDSGSSELPSDPIVRSLGNMFGKIVNQRFRVTMAPTGEIRNVEVPPGLLETLRTAAAGTPGGLDDEGLKQMLGQTSVILPSGEVEKGHIWSSKQEIVMPFGTLNVSPQMTYRGITDSGIAAIQYIPSVELEPKRGTPVKLSLTRSDGTGSVKFDVGRGRIARMQLDLDMDMVTEVRGQKITQKLKQKTLMTLAE